MAGITGQGTTFNLPNFVGDLFDISPEDTPLLSAIGGLTGGEAVQAKRFDWEFYDLAASNATKGRLEGAAAPTAGNRVRANAHNVVQIVHEALSISYTKLAAVGALTTNGDAVITSAGGNPVQNEYDWQVTQALKQIARDTNDSFINGVFAEPADNATARQTRGLLQAIVTNVQNMHDKVPTVDDVLTLMQSVYDNGGIQEGDTRTLIVGSSMRRLVTKLFITDLKAGFYNQSRTVGGVSVQTIQTDFGVLNVMLDRYVPKDTMIVASLEDLSPAILEIPGKGFLFLEPLAKVGSSQDAQIYGEIGLKYGNERKHGKLIAADAGYAITGSSGS